MIHYHGLPITPNSAAIAAVNGGHAFVSFARPDQLGIVLDVCQSFAIDTGALCVQCTACGASSTLIYQLMDDATHLLMELWNKRRSATRIVDVDALRNDLLAVMRYESRRMGAVSAAVLKRALARLDGE